MADLQLQIIDRDGKIRAQAQGESVQIAFRESYQEGDTILLQSSQKGVFIMASLDEALAPTLLYISEHKWTYQVLIEPELRMAYSPKIFSGNVHYLWARLATKDEINSYRNLALNPHDQKIDSGAYPHAFANVETRNESTFFARNAIDGVFANEGHGKYPYASWGINQQADAALTIDFGREVEVDRVALTLRGDYPHDSYWTRATIEFSDGSKEILELEKILLPQSFEFVPRMIRWIRLEELIKAEDESPFPALTQIEVYGHEILQS